MKSKEKSIRKPEILFLTNFKNDPYSNMAIDEYFLNQTEKKKINGILRFYTWNPPTISIGYFFKTKFLNMKKIKKDNIKIVRRLTGGNLIFHKDDFTYSLIIKKGIYNITDKKKFYFFISLILQNALKMINIDSIINTSLEIKKNDPDCFSSISDYEISTPDGNKLIGSAQKIQKNSFLQHGTFSYNYDPNEISRYLFKKFNIKKKLDLKINQSIIQKKFMDSFNEHFKLNKYNLSKIDLKKINMIIQKKYSSDDWNYGK